MVECGAELALPVSTPEAADRIRQEVSLIRRCAAGVEAMYREAVDDEDDDG